MTTIALRHLAQINPSTPEFDDLAEDAPVTFLPLEAVWSDSRADHSRTVQKASVASGYTRFQAGDVVCPKVAPTFQAGRSMLARSVGAGTTELHVLRAREDVDPRWICYALRSKQFLDEGVASYQGVAGLQRVPPWFVASFRVADCDAVHQRRVADFLDDRLGRIDQIIRTRREQAALLREWEQAAIDAIVQCRADERMTRLGRVASVQSGITVDAGRAAVDKPVRRPYLRVANVQAGHLDLSEIKEVTVPADLAERTALRPGDVLMTEGGDLDKLGRGTVWNGEIRDCLHQNHVFAVRPDRSLMIPEFLAAYTRSTDARHHFSSTGTKTTNLASTSSSKVRDLPIPTRLLADQQTAVVALKKIAADHDAGTTSVQRSIELLTEYKTSLITAAVTGELDVTTAGSGIPG